MATLTMLKWEDKNGGKQKFELIKLVSSKWKDFGIRLQQTMNDLEGWEVQYMRDFKLCWCKVMQEWLNMGTSDYPATWKGVIVMLEDISFAEVARKLENALAMTSPPPAPPPVFEMRGITLDPQLSHQLAMWLRQKAAFEVKQYEIVPLKVVKP